MDALVQDLRYALASMRRNLPFAAAALSTLALGIGATTAIFSIVYGVLLRPLPFEPPTSLVRPHSLGPTGETHGAFRPPLRPWPDRRPCGSLLAAQFPRLQAAEPDALRRQLGRLTSAQLAPARF